MARITTLGRRYPHRREAPPGLRPRADLVAPAGMPDEDPHQAAQISAQKKLGC